MIEENMRPYKSLEEMNFDIISKCNEVIKPNDTLYYLGDFAFALYGDITKVYDLRNQINCKNFKYVLGNHDKHIKKNKKRLLQDEVFEEIEYYMEVKYYGKNIVLFHHPITSWNDMHKGFYHLYGHCHNSLPDNPNSLSLDCGVDTHNFYPYSFEEVDDRMSKKKFIPVDHHV